MKSLLFWKKIKRKKRGGESVCKRMKRQDGGLADSNEVKGVWKSRAKHLMNEETAGKEISCMGIEA